VRAVSLMRPRGVGGLRRVFIGREAELEHLQTAYLILRSAGPTSSRSLATRVSVRPA
jgi:hypothetical protein